MKIKSVSMSSRTPRITIGFGLSSLAAAFVAAIALTAFPLSALADVVSPVDFDGDCPVPYTAHVVLSTGTSGATIFFTVNTIHPPGNPTHSGGSPTGTSGIYNPALGGLTVPSGTKLYVKAIAYKAGSTDSEVTSYECDNTLQ